MKKMKITQAVGKRSARLIAGLMSLALLLLLGGCTPTSGERTESAYIMDTLVSITLPADTPDQAFTDAFAQMSRLEDLLSAEKADSEISRLNRERALSSLDADTYTLLSRCLDYANLSGGAFNPCMGTLIQLWDITAQSPRVPAPDQIDQAKAHISPAALNLSDGGAVFTQDEVQINLGAIAKGYAADQAAQLLRSYGVKRGIISMGGNVVIIGSKTAQSPWRVGIRDPLGSADEIIGYVEGGDLSIVTSGGYERYFELNGVRYHHILDPQSGYPADSGLISVTVICADGTLADMLSTAVFVMGAEPAKALLAEIDEPVELILVDQTQQITLLGDTLAPFTFTAAAGGYRYEG